jgi:hypothetical protein
LGNQGQQGLARQRWQAIVFSVFDDLDQALYFPGSLSGDQAKLTTMTAQGCDSSKPRFPQKPRDPTLSWPVASNIRDFIRAQFAFPFNSLIR